jgi:hypothetical protein
MTRPASRRGFLSGLATLPLIGGSVALIGSPSAVAIEPSPALLREYHNWLAYERWWTATELGHNADTEYFSFFGPAHRWHRDRSGGEPWAPLPAIPPSTRAALVLSAVGCDWREDVR